jgi:hypothetical protein
VLRKVSPTAVWQKIHNHLPQPETSEDIESLSFSSNHNGTRMGPIIHDSSPTSQSIINYLTLYQLLSLQKHISLAITFTSTYAKDMVGFIMPWSNSLKDINTGTILIMRWSSDFKQQISETHVRYNRFCSTSNVDTALASNMLTRNCK